MPRDGYKTERPELWRRVSARLGVLGMTINDLLECMHEELRGGAGDPKRRSVHRTKLHDTLNGVRPVHEEFVAAVAAALALDPSALAAGSSWAPLTAEPPKGWKPQARGIVQRRGKKALRTPRAA